MQVRFNNTFYIGMVMQKVQIMSALNTSFRSRRNLNIFKQAPDAWLLAHNCTKSRTIWRNISNTMDQAVLNRFLSTCARTGLTRLNWELKSRGKSSWKMLMSAGL